MPYGAVKLGSRSPIDVRQFVGEAFGIAVSQMRASIFVVGQYGITVTGKSFRVTKLMGFDTENMTSQNKPHFVVPLPNNVALMVNGNDYNGIILQTSAIKNKQEFLLRS